MELRQNIGGKYLLSTIFTVFVVLLITFLGPVNAVNVSLVSSTSNPQYNQLVTFTAGIDLETNERVPINYIKAVVKDSSNNVVSSCDFAVNGTKLQNCSSSFESISVISSNSAFNEGNLSVNNSGTMVDYGYGYGYIYGNNIFQEIKYNIAYRTPSTIKNTTEIYSISLEVYTGANSVNSIITTQSPVVINVAMQKPLAVLRNTNLSYFETEEILIDASSSLDPNNFAIISYNIYDSNYNLIKQSQLAEFQLDNIAVGINDLYLEVVNVHNISSTKLPFVVEVKSNFNSDNLELVVDDFITESTINFKINADYSFSNKTVSVNPRMVCMNIAFDLKNGYDKEISFRSSVSNYAFKLKTTEFDLNVPIDSSCMFYVDLIDTNTNQKVTLSKAVIFRDAFSEGSTNTQITLNNGNDLSGFLFKGLNKGFDRGFNSLTYNFKNDGPTPIKVEMIVSIGDLNIESFEEFKINANSESEVFIPLYVDEKVSSGKYPVRISYRINDAADLKVQYGYLIIN